jgi:hypothetical protein
VNRTTRSPEANILPTLHEIASNPTTLTDDRKTPRYRVTEIEGQAQRLAGTLQSSRTVDLRLARVSKLGPRREEHAKRRNDPV